MSKITKYVLLSLCLGVAVILFINNVRETKAGDDTITVDLATNIFTNAVTVSSSALNAVRIGIESALPKIVFNENGYSPQILKMSAGSLILGTGVGGFSIDTSNAARFTGALAIPTAAAIRGTLTATVIGQIYLNTTTAGQVCVSTGTDNVYQWMIIDGSANCSN